jgi:hypothetical protein
MASTDSSSTPLFGSELISPEVLKQLPEGYSCRPIQRSDYHNGFLDVLRVLTTVGDVTEEVRKTSLYFHHQLSLPFPHSSFHPLVPTPLRYITTHADIYGYLIAME